MSRARQSLKKRLRHVARQYNAMRASWGPEWERIRERIGLPPCRDYDPQSVGYKLANNSIYGKMAYVPVR